MTPLVSFLLQQIGVPVVTMIIKEWQTAHNNTWPTPEQVAQTFIDDVAKYTSQGNAWLLANPLPVVIK
jgi:hypothetical protein